MMFFKKAIIVSIFFLLSFFPLAKLLADTTTYNFSGVNTGNDGINGNPIAIEHDSDIFPWTTIVEQNDSVNPTDAEYINISTNNTSQWATDDPGRNDEIVITYKFFIQETISDISNIQIKWNGNTDGILASNHSVFLRKNNFDEFGGTNTWVQLGSSLSIPQDTNTDLIRDLTADFGTYVDETSGQFEFVVTTDGNSEDLRTNYIELIVTYTTTPTPDTTPPSAISDLSSSGATTNSIDLNWTATGDDGDTGTISSYDIRYSTATITESTWSSSTQISGEPSPSVAGSSESMTISGLNPDTLYYFAVKSSDEVPNISDISNVTSLSTNNVPPVLDNTPPSAISDLNPSEATYNSINLNWTAVGDDGITGIATSYDIRYAISPITEATWSSATLAIGEPSPSSPGDSESFNITNISSETTYYFAIKTSDESGNQSTISNIPSLSTLAEPSIFIPTNASGGVAATSVIFSGLAYPESKIIIQSKDSVNPIYNNVPLSAYSISDSGEFYVSYTALLSGAYFFTLQAQDKNNQKTDIISFNIDFRTDKKLIVEDIFLSPTLSFNQDLLRLSDALEIYGYSSPNSKIKLEIDDIILEEIISDEDGYYSFEFSPGDFALGIHYARVSQSKDDRESNYTSPRSFKITSLIYPKADFNRDNSVNVTDWSVFLYRWGDIENNLRNEIDLDSNGIIDVSDFSIFLKAIKII